MDIKSTARLIQSKFEVKSEEILLIDWIYINTYTMYLCMDKKKIAGITKNITFLFGKGLS